MILIITQARLSSSRLPQKVLKIVDGDSLLSIHLKRLKKSKTASKIIVATTFEPGIEKLIEVATKADVEVFQGSMNDVLDRFYKAAKNFSPDIVVRVTSDCPLIDAELLDQVVYDFKMSDVDYESNCLRPSLPDGTDVEVMSFKSLEKAWMEAKLESEREHVTSYIWKNSDVNGSPVFKAKNWAWQEDLSSYRLTVDTEDDLALIRILVKELGPEKSWIDYINYLKKNPEIRSLNSSQIRNSGYFKSLSKDRS